ncbi:hypothetical protein ACH5RR_015307 [Cinchona calisaya]|uniref:Uncharacterized protein n=1 Tax=Cinchona calisaya TaxID=153742 RepID=A0ABD2ZTZ1_9GENT
MIGKEEGQTNRQGTNHRSINIESSDREDNNNLSVNYECINEERGSHQHAVKTTKAQLRSGNMGSKDISNVEPNIIDEGKNRRKWNYTLLRELFREREIENILKTPLLPYFPDDMKVWHYSKQGKFEVKLACHLAKNLQKMKTDEREPSSSCKDMKFWKEIEMGSEKIVRDVVVMWRLIGIFSLTVNS